jgi:hypothetical protein
MRAKPGLRLVDQSPASLGLVNLALVCGYLLPVWGRDALRVLTSPYNGFEDRAHTAVAVAIRDLFDFGLDGLIRTSGGLACVKLVMAAGFLAYLIEFARALATRRMPNRESVDAVLLAALAVAGVWFAAAFRVDDAAILQLAATQFLLLVGAAVVITIERHIERLAAAQPGRDGVAPEGAMRSTRPFVPVPAFLPPAPRSDLPADQPA